MLIEGEVILFVLATGVLVWLLVNRKKVSKIEAGNILQIGYYILYVGCAATVFEGLFLADLLNQLEHGCYALSMFFVAWWSYKMFGSKEP
jgi:hypothetical protein